MHDRISQVNAWRTVKFTRLICTPLKLRKLTSKVSVQFPCSNLDTTKLTQRQSAVQHARWRSAGSTMRPCLLVNDESPRAKWGESGRERSHEGRVTNLHERACVH
eukprot:5152113-Pleurochrysis_carterae.AAC.1